MTQRDEMAGESRRAAPASRRPRRPVLAGTLQSLGVMAAFVTAGLALAVASGAGFPGSRPEPYPPAAMDEPIPQPPPSRWLIDGFNVLHVGILQGRERTAWWGSAGRSRLLERLQQFEDRKAELWVVFDGPRPASEEAARGALRVVFAPSADAWLLAQVRAAADPGNLAVVTADRRLADRLRHRGARVVTPAEFLRRCGA